MTAFDLYSALTSFALIVGGSLLLMLTLAAVAAFMRLSWRKAPR